MGGLRWTHKTTRKLAAQVRKRGIAISHPTVARLLKQQAYSLRTNRKRLAGTRDPDRDRQFRLLSRRRNRFLRAEWPIISIDTKKKEMIGNFKNPGRSWCRRHRDVFDHDFPSWADGKAIPFGIYDIARNTGYVVVGLAHETSAFEIQAIRSWWLSVGRQAYPKATRLLLNAIAEVVMILDVGLGASAFSGCRTNSA